MFPAWMRFVYLNIHIHTLKYIYIFQIRMKSKVSNISSVLMLYLCWSICNMAVKLVCVCLNFMKNSSLWPWFSQDISLFSSCVSCIYICIGVHTYIYWGRLYTYTYNEVVVCVCGRRSVSDEYREKRYVLLRFGSTMH